MTLLIVIMNDAEKNASRGLVLRRRHTATARTPPLTDLPEELIMEILLRLPARTLVSLRSVCRLWRNLISAPDFTRNHLRRRSCLRDPSLTSLRIACYNSLPLGGNGVRYDSFGILSVRSIMEKPFEPPKVDYFSGQRYNRIVGSCHGLLCFFYEDGDQNTHGMLWNPCTGFTFQSPEISGQASLCGFGYDHLSDSYKLFGILRKKGPSGLEFSTRIYTFGPTSSWRRIDDIPLFVPTDDPFMPDNMEGVFFGSSRACTINWSVNQQVVVYFDLDKETYGHFSLPYTDSDDYFQRMGTYLCILGNCLSVCYEHLNAQCWFVWQMKEYGDAQSWTKLAIIPFHPQLVNLGSPLQSLYISESGELLAISPSLRIVLYDLKNGSINSPDSINLKENYPNLSQSIGFRMAYIYHESLVSPKGLQSNSSKMLLQKPKSIVS
ncbi:F-box/kelch-repeat protein At3g23880-like [Arachis ipaensis]|uniref:F-box/kelch-repeat protein At3g23880-like n=1 Tax=Arachis ipaensis TaxID=130454 RepID=UPI000A2AF095|nr:F-box/kelch-repeat protein At3g23880-like [Arachis ipaensis]XP_029150792.1 F-box/kelch-repeat protein At3g23880-like [Arachis hypogaea]